MVLYVRQLQRSAKSDREINATRVYGHRLTQNETQNGSDTRHMQKSDV